MANDVTIDESDEGKTVVTADGEEVGIVSGVRGGRAYVDPDPGLTDKLNAKLGWDDIGDDDYPLNEKVVMRITDDEIHLGEM